MSSCGGEVSGGAGKAGPVGSELGQRRDSGRHFDPDIAPVLGVMEESEQPCKEEFSPKSPVTKALEQWETLRGQDGVWQRRVVDAAREHTWLLVNPFSL